MYFILMMAQWFCVLFCVSHLFALLCLVFTVFGLVTCRIALWSEAWLISFFPIYILYHPGVCFWGPEVMQAIVKVIQESSDIVVWNDQLLSASFHISTIAKSCCYCFFWMCVHTCACSLALTCVHAEARDQCWYLAQLFFIFICEEFSEKFLTDPTTHPFTRLFC